MQTPSLPVIHAGLPRAARRSARWLRAAAACVAVAVAGIPGAAAAQLSLAYSVEGPFDYVAAGSSLRTQSNNGNACAVAGSASATVSGVPAGATVVQALLYWSGSGSTDAAVVLNGSTVNADRTTTDAYNNGGTLLTFFGAMADVTARVSGNGTYTVSGLSVNTGGSYCTSSAVVAGWALYVVYENPGSAPRRLQIRDGFEVIRTAASSYTLTGFTGAATPSVRMSTLVWEGDGDISGDERIRFNGGVLHSGTNVHNSSGAPGDTYGHGLDLESYVTTLPAGATSATVSVETGSDLVLLQTVVTSIAVANAYAVNVTPKGLGGPVQRLPGSGYTLTFAIAAGSNVDAVHDLVLSGSGNPFFVAVTGIAGPGIQATARPDSFVVNLAYGDTAYLTVTYQVPAGPPAVNTGTLRARVRAAPAVFSDGWAEIQRVSPSLTLSKTVDAPAALGPGAELTYEMRFANVGGYEATTVQVTDQVPPEVLFKLGSTAQTLPGGLTATVEFSTDAGATWTYVPGVTPCDHPDPVPAGYDGCVEQIRWTLSGPLPAGEAQGSGTVRFVARIR